MSLFGKKSVGKEAEAPPLASIATTVGQPLARSPAAGQRPSYPTTTDTIRDQVLNRIEPAIAVRLTRPQLTDRVFELVAEIANQQRLLLNEAEQQGLAATIVDEMIGLGALESLLRDPSVNDILVNGPKMTYVERHGKLELTQIKFRNDAHVMHVAQRIASQIGRRVDEFEPHA